jgi:segregation and condensation protein A
MRLYDPALGGEFMVLAASLIELKSKMLLPRSGAADVAAEEDPRSELVMKLLLYKKFKGAAALLLEREARASLLFEKPAEDLSVYTDEPDEYLRMEPERFVQAFRSFLGRKRRMDEIKNLYARAERQRETTETRMSFIKGLFARKKVGRLRFPELLNRRGDRFETVLTFVALLEMVRNRTVRAKQNGTFTEITVELYEKEAPAYVE